MLQHKLLEHNCLGTFLGCGIGLRTRHYQEILAGTPDSLGIDWLEIVSENYMIPGGKPLYYLDQFNERYPLVMHGVSMSIGSADPLDWDYLHALKKLMQRITPCWVSDHLCWTGVQQINTHDLLPLPFTQETIEHIVSRIHTVQDFLERPLVLENISSYMNFSVNTMPEWEFITQIIQQANCYLLLDINNLYVNAYNHHFDPVVYLEKLPADKIVQIHLAGHTNYGDYIIDTHDQAIIPDVWQLYKLAIQKFGAISTLIERDQNIPPLAELLAECQQARQYLNMLTKSTPKESQALEELSDI